MPEQGKNVGGSVGAFVLGLADSETPLALYRGSSAVKNMFILFTLAWLAASAGWVAYSAYVVEPACFLSVDGKHDDCARLPASYFLYGVELGDEIPARDDPELLSIIELHGRHLLNFCVVLDGFTDLERCLNSKLPVIMFLQSAGADGKFEDRFSTQNFVGEETLREAVGEEFEHHRDQLLCKPDIGGEYATVTYADFEGDGKFGHYKFENYVALGLWLERNAFSDWSPDENAGRPFWGSQQQLSVYYGFPHAFMEYIEVSTPARFGDGETNTRFGKCTATTGCAHNFYTIVGDCLVQAGEKKSPLYSCCPRKTITVALAEWYALFSLGLTTVGTLATIILPRLSKAYSPLEKLEDQLMQLLPNLLPRLGVETSVKASAPQTGSAKVSPSNV